MDEQQTLAGFLQETKTSCYCNPAGVQLVLNPKGSLLVCSAYPGIETPEHIFLELYQEVGTINVLMGLTRITSVDRLAELTPTDLVALYERELLNISCILDGAIPHEMRFWKHHKSTWASNTREEIHHVKMHFDKAEDFIAYTLHYYEARDN